MDQRLLILSQNIIIWGGETSDTSKESECEYDERVSARLHGHTENFHFLNSISGV